MPYIKEVQGLRAVAALLVAVYHIWFNRVSGGVDAFFVIAAFFLMTTFAKLDRPAGRDVLRYYGATARRVCPLAAVVILSTIASTLLFAPQIHWREFAFHAFASTVFIENWWLAWSGADYLRQDLAVSPFQQMWALSLQMQYYLLLPLFLWAIAECARWRDVGVRAAWTAALGMLLAVSLAYSIWVTDRNQPWAYFDSFARGWEYMFGALLALYIDRLPKVTERHAKLIGYASLMVLVGFAAVIPVASSFPGFAALIPVLATSVLIASARAGADIAPLTNRPILALGDISFSFYLWHWPLLIFWRQWTGETAVGLLPGMAIILFAGVLAWATLRLIETPFRRWPLLLSRPALSVIASILLMVPALGATYVWADANRDALRTAQAQLADFSADPQSWDEADPIVPDPLLAKSDNARAYADGCHQTIFDPALVECTYGDRSSERTLILIGGSHSLQWLPALEDIAPKLGLRIVTMTKSSCIFIDPTDPKRFIAAATAYGLDDPESCLGWNRAARHRVMELDPAAVMTIGTRGQGADETVPDIFRSLWRDLATAGIPVLALRDNPWFAADVVECVAEAADNPSTCDQPRAELLRPVDPGAGLDGPLLSFVDLSDLYCDSARCWVIRDGVLLYRDSHHLTGSFVRRHAARLETEIATLIDKS